MINVSFLDVKILCIFFFALCLLPAGMLFAQKSASPVVSQTVTMAGTSGFSALSSSHSPTSSSSTSSKGPN